MADIFDYMHWRGDIPFSQVPLNDIDNLILSRASYIPFDGIIPPEMESSLTLGQAAKLYLEKPDAKERVCMENDYKLCCYVAEYPRFADVPVLGYENKIDTGRELQFSAMVYRLAPEKHFVAYRGTDNTFVGWKEDFNMTFTTPIPAQLEAVCYLERAAAALPGRLILGGHSKGGNLSVYAAAYASASIQSRIDLIYSNDGPGFSGGVMLTDGYLAISDRIRSFVPQSSVVGMLLEHEEDYTIVKSKNLSFWQHDLYSWEVMGSKLVAHEGITNGSRFIDRTLKDWLAQLAPEQREKFVDGVFLLLEQSNAESFNEFRASKLTNIVSVIRSAAGLDEETRSHLVHALGLLAKSAKENVGDFLPKFPPKFSEKS